MAFKTVELENLTQNDIEYIEKIEWLWNKLTPIQRSQVIDSVTSGILSQQNSFYCVIGRATSAKRIQIRSNRSPFGHILKLGKAIFYDGPSYDGLLEAKLTPEDQKKLNEIYYAKIGNKENQYQRANKLVIVYVKNKMSCQDYNETKNPSFD